MSSSTRSDTIPGEGHLYRPVPSGKMFLPAIMGNGVAIKQDRASGTKDVCALSWFTDGCSILCWGSFCVQTLVNSGRGSPVSCFLHFSLSVVLPHCLIPFCHFDPHKISPRSSFSWHLLFVDVILHFRVPSLNTIIFYHFRFTVCHAQLGYVINNSQHFYELR